MYDPTSNTMSTLNEMGIEVAEPEYDPVDRPRHYNRDNAMECIDEMELVFGPTATAHYCLLNCWKYRYRAGDKNGHQDMEKSDWYMRKYKELMEKVNNNTLTIPYTPPPSPWMINPTIPTTTYTTTSGVSNEE